MKNILRFSLIIIGAGLIGFGLYSYLFPETFSDTKLGEDHYQALAMMAFGVLCLLSGLAYKRR
ncbi:MAG TPA: hypothetical protein VK021_12420 [Flavobacteriaceae bacterium]|nr:hypothetical protein [Flavobacteriaceae bacterium]